MELPVKYVWSHDSFRVGEDGPTHQPVEHEAQLRLLEQTRNLSGKRSMLVLRPADTAEAVIAWRMAMENTSTPTRNALLHVSRQGAAPPAANRASKMPNRWFSRGICCHGRPRRRSDARRQRQRGIAAGRSRRASRRRRHSRARCVGSLNRPVYGSERGIPHEHHPAPHPVFGLTAGLPSTLWPLTGCNGRVYGLDASAHRLPPESSTRSSASTPPTFSTKCAASSAK